MNRIFVEVVDEFVVSSVYNPEDEQALLDLGYFMVDSLPVAENIRGKGARLKYTEVDGFFYEYVPRPLSLEEQFAESKKTAQDRYNDIKSLGTLEEVKAAKLAALDEACNIAIINGFDHEINGVSYRFSCSMAAQANFQGTDSLFKDGLITEVDWTVVNNATGRVERVKVDYELFKQLRLAVFQHINSQITKLRDVLQPEVEDAKFLATVDTINW